MLGPLVLVIASGYAQAPTLTAHAAPPTPPRDISVAPESNTEYRPDMTAVQTDSYSISTANPVSTAAARDVLAAGGTAADALVTAQLVLGLVEPQSSGIGGGGYILYHDAASDSVTAIDGRETAPDDAPDTYLSQISATDTRTPQPDARRSGRSIGVPGIMAALGTLHAQHGKTQWGDLVQPAITLSENGFDISPRLATTIEDNAADLARDPEAAAYYLNPDGTGKKTGTRLTNPAYATTLTSLKLGGPQVLYTGKIADDIVARARSNHDGTTPSSLTTADLAKYNPTVKQALCGPYRTHIVCGAPPSTSGGVTVTATLGILSHANLSAMKPLKVDENGGVPSPEAVHTISEAERLTYADRDAYLADTDFENLPDGDYTKLLNPEYLAQRYSQINPEKSMGTAKAGTFDTDHARGEDQPEHGTSHISVVDSYGNAASMTTSVESAFGSFHMVDGFMLNNQLTDFEATPRDDAGHLKANRVEGGKRPRSSMSPTIVYTTTKTGERGDLYAVVGSPGGAVIPQFVIKTLVGILDWGLDPQQAVALPNFGARNTPDTGIGGEHPDIGHSGTATPEAHELIDGLTCRGHTVNLDEQSSGLSAIVRTRDGHLLGGADPRREGTVMGGALPEIIIRRGQPQPRTVRLEQPSACPRHPGG